MNGEVGTVTQLMLAQSAGNADAAIYSNFAPAVVLAIFGIILLCFCMDLIKIAFEYIIWWIFLRGDDDDE